MDFRKKRNLVFLIFLIIIFFLLIKTLSPNNVRNDTPNNPKNSSQKEVASLKNNKKKTPPAVTRQSSGLVLPDNIGEVNTSNRTNYIENALNQNGQALKFHKMPIKVYIQDGEYNYLARNALMEWQKSTGVLSFVYANSPRNAQMQIKFVTSPLQNYDNGYFSSGNTNYKANSRTGELVNSEILILTQYKDKPLKKEIIYHTLLHEIGHAIGICGHSDEPSDVMSTANAETNEHLSLKDIETVRLIYSNNDFKRDSALYKSAKYKQIKQNLQKIPHDYNAWVQLGDFYLEGKYYDNAYKCFLYLTELNPNDPIGYSRLGSYYNKIDDFDNAFKNLKIAHLKKPNEPIFIYDLAAICYNYRKKDMAKDYLETFINNNPSMRNDQTFAQILDSYGL